MSLDNLDRVLLDKQATLYASDLHHISGGLVLCLCLVALPQTKSASDLVPKTVVESAV